MKKFFVLAAIAATLVISISSCKKEECPEAYEGSGSNCTPFNKLHEGTYTGNVLVSGTSMAMVVVVSAATEPTGLHVEINSDVVNASANGSNAAQLSFSSQTVGGNTYANGHGEFSSTQLLMTFDLTTGGGSTASCVFTGTK